ncbi:NADPH-dependent FMN reductase [Limnobacter parvus]|uniref:NAD(P)H-dependent oxidoreductase n=1 Tax=Limnobacter parvus TaxID=2939690 RepID=A0ABT1XDX1_9BURK|nr:NAD(P)H-dependent oxidoreductase [Limnobacter parvus]MCR2745475.1 NAD(P)H-dependent oxidoreductase [Limnobacter parvus]
MSNTIRVLGISGSLRAKSCNTGLLRAASAQLPQGMEIQFANLIDLPFFNADLGERPAAVQAFFDQLQQADALLLACPEYNYSIAPALKNAIDWASRYPDNALLSGKAVAICGAGGGMGTSRAQYHLRQVCVYLDLHPLNKPEVFANAFAGGFDADGNVIDEKIKSSLAAQLLALKAWSQLLKGKD